MIDILFGIFLIILAYVIGYILSLFLPRVIGDFDGDRNVWGRIKLVIAGIVFMLLFAFFGNFLGCNDDNDGFQSHEIFDR